MKRFDKFTSTWTDADGNSQTLTYYRAKSAADASAADERNDAEEMQVYADACAAGVAMDVQTTVEDSE